MPVIYLVARRAETLDHHHRGAHAGRALRDARPRPAAPRPAPGDQHPARRPGRTLIFGIIVAVPTVVVAGPLFGRLAGSLGRRPASRPVRPSRGGPPGRPPARLRPDPGDGAAAGRPDDAQGDRRHRRRRRPEPACSRSSTSIGNPLVALLIAVLVAMFTFGRASGMDRAAISTSLGASLAPDRGHLPDRRRRRWLQAGARRHGHRHPARRLGQGRQRLGDPAGLGVRGADPARHGLGDDRHHHRVRADARRGRRARLRDEVSLVVLAVGCGSVFFSHVNDAGFWLVKEYFGLSVGQTLKTWSADGDRAHASPGWSSCCC